MAPGANSPEAPLAPQAPHAVKAPETPEAFVCEDDVRLAIREGRKLLVSEKTIITPSARDAGETAKIFLHAGWPSS